MEQIKNRAEEIKKETFMELDKIVNHKEHMDNIQDFVKALDNNFERIREQVGLIPIQDIESSKNRRPPIKKLDNIVFENKTIRYSRIIFNNERPMNKMLNVTLDNNDKRLNIRNILKSPHRKTSSFKA